jgi:hypothetical protein
VGSYRRVGKQLLELIGNGLDDWVPHAVDLEVPREDRGGFRSAYPRKPHAERRREHVDGDAISQFPEPTQRVLEQRCVVECAPGRERHHEVQRGDGLEQPVTGFSADRDRLQEPLHGVTDVEPVGELGVLEPVPVERRQRGTSQGR